MDRQTIQTLKREIEKYAKYKSQHEINKQGPQEYSHKTDYDLMEKSRRKIENILYDEWMKSIET